MSRRDPAGADIGTKTPNVARIYDYLLGGKDNFAADRAAAAELMTTIPDIAAIVRDNRTFIGRVVRYLAEEIGIRQFLDLGAGLPTQANVHEMAQRLAPDAHVVYVDNDPVVWSHGQALLSNGRGVTMVHADLCQPSAILKHPDVVRLLDFSRPVALMCACVLHFVADDERPYQIMGEYRDHLAPGSYLAISHGVIGTAKDDPGGLADTVTGVYESASAQLHLRSLAGIRRFFDGFDLVDPGVVWMTGWRPDPGVPSGGRPHAMLGGVGRKP
jgi:hypothetical protein